ncbi:g9364 [Coccomyxa elongata]
MCVCAYLTQHLWRQLEKCPSPAAFFEHHFRQNSFGGGVKGNPDWVVLGCDTQFLLAVEAKTVYSMPLPADWTLAAAYANDAKRPYIEDALHQAYGYMVANELRYAVIATAQAPGQLIAYTGSASEPAIPQSVGRAVNSSLVAPASWPLHALKELVRFALRPACGKTKRSKAKQDRAKRIKARQSKAAQQPDSSTKEVWTWEELSITGWIARGRTGSVFSGCIGGSPVAIKVADYRGRFSKLKEVQEEVEMLDYLHAKQGQAVPRKIAQGYIVDSTCYFVATELLGETLRDAPPDEFPGLEEAALAALDRVHAAGVLHNDVRPSSFLRAGQRRVVLADFAYAELSSNERDRQRERARLRELMRLRRPPFRPSQPAAPSDMGKLLTC